MNKKLARIAISKDFIVKAIHLPETATIRRMYCNYKYSEDVVYLIIQDESLEEVASGAIIPEVNPIVTKLDNGEYKFDWNQK